LGWRGNRTAKGEGMTRRGPTAPRSGVRAENAKVAGLMQQTPSWAAFWPEFPNHKRTGCWRSYFSSA
jgi:hypothetical protein